MRALCAHPLFISGLALRLLLIAVMAPAAVANWYAPFLDTSTASFVLDPWRAWLAQGGTPIAFPYGYAMWLCFLPGILLAKLALFPLVYGYAATLVAADFALLLVLDRLVLGRPKLVLTTYWLSPVILVATYALGLNDIVPAALLTGSMLAIKRLELRAAGLLCATAISAKLSMVVALPLLAVYLYNNGALRARATQFASGFAIGVVLFGLTFLFSGAGVQMLAENPELRKIYQLSVPIGETVVYLVPLIYLAMLYLTWRVRRLNFELFHATTGIAFLLIVLMTPASPGWFVWTIPFLVLYQAMSGRVAVILVAGFSALYVLTTLSVTALHFASGQELALESLLRLTTPLGNRALSLLQTAMVAIGAILALRIWREAVSLNDFFRLSRRPFVIGIAGDSGSGKDTFADSLIGLFGAHSSVKLSGDDYHLWDRQKPIWQVMTHLNPRANDLEGFSNDLVSLVDDRSIQSRHYDHETGKMSKPFRIGSNDFIVACGLHALYLPILRECYNLKIFLDIDEGLRRHFKTQRDVHVRGHTIDRVEESFVRRAPDSERFIRPQAAHADLILSLQPIHPQTLEQQGLGDGPLRLKLVVRTRTGFDELNLSRVLVGVCGLHVDIAVNANGSEVTKTIEGETTAADVEMAAHLLCPRVLEFLDVSPRWNDGMLGLMQLIALSHISQALRKRFIW